MTTDDKPNTADWQQPWQDLADMMQPHPDAKTRTASEIQAWDEAMDAARDERLRAIIEPFAEALAADFRRVMVEAGLIPPDAPMPPEPTEAETALHRATLAARERGQP